MKEYPFRYHSLFRMCRTIQEAFNVSDKSFYGIDLDLILHFLVAIILYFILLFLMSPQKSLIILLLIIFLKELNDFYVFYYHMDIAPRYLLSSSIDIVSSSTGVFLIHFLIKFLKTKFQAQKET